MSSHSPEGGDDAYAAFGRQAGSGCGPICSRLGLVATATKSLVTKPGGGVRTEPLSLAR